MELKKHKITLYFKSGNSIEFSCDEYSFKINNETLEFSGYNFKGMSPVVSFVPSRLEFYIVK